MSDAHTTEPETPKTAASTPPAKGGASRLIVDVGPLVLWILAYNVANRIWPDEAIFIGTGVYLAATLAAAAYALIVEKRIPLMLAVTAVIVTIFGAATLILHNALFAYIKPTIIYLMFAVGIFGSLLVRQNVLKSLLGASFDLPDHAWRTYAIRWGVWFVFLAILNELIWRNFSEAFWANFKLFGFLPLVLAFSLANMPFILKHTIEPESEPGPEPGPEPGSEPGPEKKTGPAE